MDRKQHPNVCILVLLFSFAITPAADLAPVIAGCQRDKLLASDGTQNDCFASAVDISGNKVVVGAYHEDPGGKTDAGSAYIFHFDDADWIQQPKLSASDRWTSDWFGYAAAISGDVALIGAYGNDDNGSSSGSAYVFRFDGADWTEQAKLLPADGNAGDYFGKAVALRGNVAVVGAHGDDDNGLNAGSVYIFRYVDANWVQETKLLAADANAGDAFGGAVAIDGNTLVIGASNDDHGDELDAGSVYVYHYEDANWTQEAKLPSPDSNEADYFGCSVAISGNVIVVGTANDDENGSNAGAAYIFHFNGSSWAMQAKLMTSDGDDFDYFGRAVGISSDANTVVVGSYGDDDNGSAAGAAYIFRFDGSTWAEKAKLLTGDGEPGDWFGYALAISGDEAVIAAQFDDDKGSSSGSAYVFDAAKHTADFDGNCEVDFIDFAIFAIAWLTESGDARWNPDCDMADPNGIIDEFDLDVFTDNWLTGK